MMQQVNLEPNLEQGGGEVAEAQNQSLVGKIGKLFVQNPITSLCFLTGAMGVVPYFLGATSVAAVMFIVGPALGGGIAVTNWAAKDELRRQNDAAGRQNDLVEMMTIGGLNNQNRPVLDLSQTRVVGQGQSVLPSSNIVPDQARMVAEDGRSQLQETQI